MPVCEHCGRKNSPDARFCSNCGVALGARDEGGVEERKVVSVLFCDLVGFTTLSHDADPEDVSRLLDRYHATVRAETERFGGRLEKFIGDAAVGVWGAPVAREDDAERAVRAALAIVEAVDVDVRLAVNTGEALVKLAARHELGEAVVAGDVVNTAARLQTAAPVGAVVAGAATVEATRAAVEYEPLQAVELRGKPAPVSLWRAVAVQPTGRNIRRDARFVGRTRELRLLQDLYERVVGEPGLQLVTLVGEPGIGKSRLVHEFEAWLDDQASQAEHRRGRCLAYGDGVGFWPLAEVVKAQIGLGETESKQVAQTKLQAAVEGMPDAPWLRARLGGLVGLGGEAGEREEVFAAWTRFFDQLASRHPLVLVVEDLHWASEAMLAFLHHLTEWSAGVPLMVVCTARPELLEKQPQWAGGQLNATTLQIRPLHDADARLLAHDLLVERDLPDDMESRLVEWSAGNPLYAEEYARLLIEGAARTANDVGMPASVQAVIAARIDTLTGDQKALLHDAAVIGKVFWAGALCTVGRRDPVEVRQHLHAFARKELIRAARTSSVPGDDEFAFWHDLVHEVSYRQIPRRARAEIHRRTARWIEATADVRLADRAELIAHHYDRALNLTSELGQPLEESDRAAAVRFLAMAGDQAIALDRGRAERLLHRAVELAEDSDAEASRIRSRLAECAILDGHNERAQEIAREARHIAERHQDASALGDAYLVALQSALQSGDWSAAEQLTSEAPERLEALGPTPQLAYFLAWAGAAKMLTDEFDDADAVLRRAARYARMTGNRTAEGFGGSMHAMVRAMIGEPDAVEDLEAACGTLVEAGSAWTPVAMLQVADGHLLWNGPAAASPYFEQTIGYCQRIGSKAHEMWSRGENCWRLSDQGLWDDLLGEADCVLGWAEGHQVQHAALVAPYKARVLALRGALSAAREIAETNLEHARSVRHGQVLAPALAAAALVEYLAGEPDSSRALLDELGDRVRSCWAPTAEVCRILIGIGDATRVREIVDGIDRGPTRLVNAVPSVRGALAEADGDPESSLAFFRDATAGWRAYGNPLELAYALQGASRALAALDRSSESTVSAAEAESLHAALGATLAGAVGGPSDLTAA